MNKVLIALYSIFSVGFFLKFFHIHYNALLMLAALGGILIVGLVTLFKKEKTFEATVILGVWAWLALLLISIKFFPFGMGMLVLAAIILLVNIFIANKKRQFLRLFPIVLVMTIALSFYLTPTHTRFYMVSVKWNYEIETDFMTLDKYSWFLFQNSKKEEAISISDRALKIAQESGQKKWFDFIKEHNDSIRKDDWLNYR